MSSVTISFTQVSSSLLSYVHTCSQHFIANHHHISLIASCLTLLDCTIRPCFASTLQAMCSDCLWPVARSATTRCTRPATAWEAGYPPVISDVALGNPLKEKGFQYVSIGKSPIRLVYFPLPGLITGYNHV